MQLHPPTDVRHLFQEELCGRNSALACRGMRGTVWRARLCRWYRMSHLKAKRIESTVLKVTNKRKGKRSGKSCQVSTTKKKKRRAITLRNKERIYLFSFHFLPPPQPDQMTGRSHQPDSSDSWRLKLLSLLISLIIRKGLHTRKGFQQPKQTNEIKRFSEPETITDKGTGQLLKRSPFLHPKHTVRILILMWRQLTGIAWLWTSGRSEKGRAVRLNPGETFYFPSGFPECNKWCVHTFVTRVWSLWNSSFTDGGFDILSVSGTMAATKRLYKTREGDFYFNLRCSPSLTMAYKHWVALWKEQDGLNPGWLQELSHSNKLLDATYLRCSTNDTPPPNMPRPCFLLFSFGLFFFFLSLTPQTCFVYVQSANCFIIQTRL